ncbi:MAG: hypothetical protein HZB46_12910, partial [Solirubrobacterales bacterium]|nr:hypothetical protein [Solirubrobacterales bacterium]
DSAAAALLVAALQRAAPVAPEHADDLPLDFDDEPVLAEDLRPAHDQPAADVAAAPVDELDELDAEELEAEPAAELDAPAEDLDAEHPDPEALHAPAEDPDAEHAAPEALNAPAEHHAPGDDPGETVEWDAIAERPPTRVIPSGAPVLVGTARRGPVASVLRFLLPILVVTGGIVAALAVAGVFGGNEATPPRVADRAVRLAPEKPVTTPLPVKVPQPAAATPIPGTSSTSPATATTPAPATATTTTP